MKIPQHIPLYGDSDYRGDCPLEDEDRKRCFEWLKKLHPEYFSIAIHVKNEGRRSKRNAAKSRSVDGLKAGVSDIIIPAKVSFVCELKRADASQSTISDAQLGYVQMCMDAGAFACIALGFEGFKDAFNSYLSGQTTYKQNSC